jgi:hypothetical protein
VLLAEERRVELAARDINEHPRQELDAFESLPIVAQRHFFFGAAVHELEEPLRQAPLGHVTQVKNVLRVFHFRKNHDVPLFAFAREGRRDEPVDPVVVQEPDLAIDDQLRAPSIEIITP